MLENHWKIVLSHVTSLPLCVPEVENPRLTGVLKVMSLD
jgi:hypothetical protein